MGERARYIRWFNELSINDVPLVGGKNASLGEMYRELSSAGIRIPNGFAVTAHAYRYLVVQAGYAAKWSRFSKVSIRAIWMRWPYAPTGCGSCVYQAPLPEDLAGEICEAYRRLCEEYGREHGRGDSKLRHR